MAASCRGVPYETEKNTSDVKSAFRILHSYERSNRVFLNQEVFQTRTFLGTKRLNAASHLSFALGLFLYSWEFQAFHCM